MTKAHFLRLYEHARWANQGLLDWLRTRAPENRRARKIFAHVLAVEHVWITRLGGRDSSTVPFWPDLGLDGCAALMRQNEAAYRQFLDEMTEAGFDWVIGYKNSLGVEFRTPVCDILTHVALHGTYHRGQIAFVLREAGSEPANTDFITFTRAPL